MNRFARIEFVTDKSSPFLAGCVLNGRPDLLKQKSVNFPPSADLVQVSAINRGLIASWEAGRKQWKNELNSLILYSCSVNPWRQMNSDIICEFIFIGDTFQFVQEVEDSSEAQL